MAQPIERTRTASKTKYDVELPVQHECMVSGTLCFVFYVSRLAGVAALQFRKEGYTWYMWVSRTASLYNNFLISIMCGLSMVWFIHDFILDRKLTVHFGSNSQTAITFTTLATAMVGVISEVNSGMNRMKHVVTCLAKIQKIKVELSHFGRHTSYEGIQQFITVWSLVGGNIIIILDAYLFVRDVLVKRDDDLFLQGTYLIFYVLVAIMKLYTLQITLIHMAVLSAFHHLNNCLENELLNVYGEGRISISSETAPTVGRLGFIYCSLGAMVKQISHCHGFVLVSIIIFILTNLIIKPYQFITNIMDDNTETYILVLQLFWIIYFSSDLVMIVEPCYRTYKQTTRTKHLISKFIQLTSPENYSLAAELELFYKHIRTTRIVYAPMKMFKLNRSNFTTILGSVTTYLVIVIEL